MRPAGRLAGVLRMEPADNLDEIEREWLLELRASYLGGEPDRNFVDLHRWTEMSNVDARRRMARLQTFGLAQPVSSQTCRITDEGLAYIMGFEAAFMEMPDHCADASTNETNNRQDAEHLRILSIFHYVVAGLLALFSMFPIVHLAIGIASVAGAFDEVGNGIRGFVFEEFDDDVAGAGFEFDPR